MKMASLLMLGGFSMDIILLILGLFLMHFGIISLIYWFRFIYRMFKEDYEYKKNEG